MYGPDAVVMDVGLTCGGEHAKECSVSKSRRLRGAVTGLTGGRTQMRFLDKLLYGFCPLTVKN